MSDDVRWITARIAEAQKRHASVTDAAAIRVENLLKDQLGERRLSSTELTSAANALISDMVPASPKVETRQ